MSFLIKKSITVYICVCVRVCTSECRCSWRPEVCDPLELAFQVTVRHPAWVLRLELWSSARAESALNSWIICPVQQYILLSSQPSYCCALQQSINEDTVFAAPIVTFTWEFGEAEGLLHQWLSCHLRLKCCKCCCDILKYFCGY